MISPPSCLGFRVNRGTKMRGEEHEEICDLEKIDGEYDVRCKWFIINESE
jgi:hypothetical protein